MSDAIYKHVEHYITGLFEQYPHPNLIYHNLEHTRNVVKRTLEIAGHYQLSDEDMQAVYIGAWFHDVGHLFADVPEHEQKSIELMKEFMQKEKNDAQLIDKVEGCILATRFPTQPKNQIEEILCDADTYHFGTKEFKKTNKQIKEELAARNYSTALIDWDKNTLDLLEKHKFYTSYCQMLLAEGKKKNIEKQRKKSLAVSADNVHSSIFDVANGANGKGDKGKNGLIPRGIQTVFRITSANHLRLSEMADRKAHILISVNAIIISIILTVFIKRAESDTRGIIPALIFLASSLATIIIAIMATRPKVTTGNFHREDVINKKTNLLFFGNFYKSTIEEYQWAMATLMKDPEYMYSVLIMDVHQLAKVLAHKYKLIRLAYDIFMVGLMITVISFILVIFIYNHTVQATTISTASGSPF